MDVAFSVTEAPNANDLEAIAQGLNQHSLPTTGDPGFLPIAVFAREPSGALIGGAVGKINWNWLDVSLLWVANETRGSGLGSSLMRRLEEEAVTRGCSNAHLDTFSYQAKPFYEKLGYSEFARLEDYPPGHVRFFLRKRLVPSDAV